MKTGEPAKVGCETVSTELEYKKNENRQGKYICVGNRRGFFEIVMYSWRECISYCEHHHLRQDDSILYFGKQENYQHSFLYRYFNLNISSISPKL